MELIEKNMSSLFKQLGEVHDEVGIANFLREALVQDAAWAPVVDALNATLHAPRQVKRDGDTNL